MTASLLVRPGVLSTPEILSRQALGPLALRPFPAPAEAPFQGAPLPEGFRPGDSARPARRGGVLPVAGLPAIPMAVSVLLLLLACLVAPEQPWNQEAICQRHAGVEACRVW